MPRRSTKLFAIAALALAMLLAGCTSSGSDSGGGGTSVADSQLNKVVKAKKIRVAVLPDFPPWSVQKANGEFEGYEVDIAKELADALGVELELVSTDGDSRLPLLKSDRVDVNISAWTATNERAETAGFTIPYDAHGAGVLYRKEDPVESYADLAGKTVSVARGSTNDTIMTNDFPKTEVTRFESIADAIAALKAGKVDACVESAVTVRTEAAKDSSLAAVDAEPLEPSLVSMGVLPGDQVWINYLNNFIRNLVASGEDQKLHQKWLHTDLADIVGISGQPSNS
ncbi:MAG TPA: transporter substrate-binding domain-containing protein [Nocardioidaceae bacterium]|nr:transporter substrate-binding domain-containing protein [Nocardioidaceae bacterium]